MKTIKRQIYIDRVKPFIDSNLIKVFTGSRRAESGSCFRSPPASSQISMRIT